MKISVLSSGSTSNSTLILSDKAAILIDMGISFKSLKNNLANFGIEPGDLDAILVTHGHSDHISGIKTLLKNVSVPIYCTYETAISIESKLPENCANREFSIFLCEDSFCIANLSITPFEIPHDSNGTVGFTISDGISKIGFATDLGSITNVASRHLSECDALVLEMNYDYGMLMSSDRSYSLKKRISNNLGHLSNAQAFDFLNTCDSGKLKFLFPAHISRECNDIELIEQLLYPIRQRRKFEIVHTFSNCPSKTVVL